MKKIKLVCTYAIAFICVMTTLFLPKQQIEVFKSTTGDMEDKILIYMINDDHQLVPVTLNYQKSESDEENILQLFQLMKHEIGIYDLKALIPVSIQCLDVDIQNELVQISFNEAFFTMSSHIELRVIEAIVSSVVQFNENYQVEFLVNQKPIEKMPLSALPMQPFDYTLGVNNFNLDSSQLHQSISRSVIELHEDETSHYYMVMTRRYPSSQSTLDFVNEVLDQTSLSLECQKIENDGDHVMLYLNEAFLEEENLVNADAILPLLYTLKMNQIGNQFSLYINDEKVWMEGSFQNVLTFDDLNLNIFEE